MSGVLPAKPPAVLHAAWQLLRVNARGRPHSCAVIVELWLKQCGGCPRNLLTWQVPELLGDSEALAGAVDKGLGHGAAHAIDAGDADGWDGGVRREAACQLRSLQDQRAAHLQRPAASILIGAGMQVIGAALQLCQAPASARITPTAAQLRHHKSAGQMQGHDLHAASLWQVHLSLTSCLPHACSAMP